MQVDVHVGENGITIITARIRCERMVPIQGSLDMLKKSSVVVTKRFEVDLTVTDALRHLLDLMRGVHATISNDGTTVEGETGILSKTDIVILCNKIMTLPDIA